MVFNANTVLSDTNQYALDTCMVYVDEVTFPNAHMILYYIYVAHKERK